MTPFFVIFVAPWLVIAGTLGWAYVVLSNRRKRMKAFADKLGLSYLGKTLHPDFPVQLLKPVGKLKNHDNVVAGERNGLFLITFEVQRHVFTSRRKSYQPTQIVALRSPKFRNTPILKEPFRLLESGPWRMVYQEKTFRSFLLGTAHTVGKPVEVEKMWALIE